MCACCKRAFIRFVSFKKSDDERKIFVEMLIKRYPQLEICSGEIEKAYKILLDCFLTGGKLLICGNGGSSADSGHIVGELMKGFLLKRELPEKLKKAAAKKFPDEAEFLCSNLQGALPAISLSAHSELISAFSNDVCPEMVYAQQVFGYGKKGDVLMGISTSGNSKNVLNAAMLAKVLEMPVIGLAGANECALDKVCDAVIHVPETETYKVQELHLPVYHYLCAKVEDEIFGK